SSSPRTREWRTKETLHQLRDDPRGVDHPVREAPLVVVPRDDPGEFAFEYRGFEAVDRRAGRLVVEVAADEGLFGIFEHALHRAIGGRLERGIELLGRGVAAWHEGEVDQADVRRRHADRGTVELALELGQHE